MRNHAIMILILALAITAILPLAAMAEDGFSRVTFTEADTHGKMPAGIEEGGFYFAKKVDYTFEEAAERVKEVFKENGFGVQFELRPDQTLKEKLDVDMPPYLLLGVCNPKIANQSLSIEEWMGVFMPCNAIVRVDDSGQTWVGAMNPMMLGEATGDPALEPVALELLHIVLKALNDV